MKRAVTSFDFSPETHKCLKAKLIRIGEAVAMLTVTGASAGNAI